MQRFWIGIFCACFIMTSALSATAAQDMPPEEQKRMSIVISQLTKVFLNTVQPQDFLNPKTPEKLLHFGALYVEKMYPLSKARTAPALLKAGGGSAPLGERLVSMQDVKKVIKKFFDYDLPTIAIGQYGSVHFDGKDLHIRMSGGAPAYWAQVTEAKILESGNITVEGVLRNPEHEKTIAFTAELKPIIWDNLETFAVVSLESHKEGK